MVDLANFLEIGKERIKKDAGEPRLAKESSRERALSLKHLFAQRAGLAKQQMG